MNRVDSPLNIWLLGVDAPARSVLEEAMGEGYHCRELDEHSPEDLSGILDMADREDPLMLWLGSRVWLDWDETRPELLDKILILPVVLLMERDAKPLIMERALELPVQQVVREPLTPSRVHDAISRALETRNLYFEMNRMAREISLGRELLERKSDVCSFLFSFFGRVGGCAMAHELADGCEESMADFCGLRGLHLAWWGEDTVVHYVLGSGTDEGVRGQWRNFMREQCRGFLAEPLEGSCLYRENPVKGRAESLVILPLNFRDRVCGLLALDLENPVLQSRDMAQALDAVRKHMALALWVGQSNPLFFAVEADEVAAKPQNEAVAYRISG